MSRTRKPTKRRTLYYFRSDRRDAPSLEEDLRAAHRLRDATEDRTFRYAEGADKEGRVVGLSWKAERGLSLGHVGLFVPDPPYAELPPPSPSPEDDTGEYPPPAGMDYLQGDVFYLVSRNHVVLCPSGVRDAVLRAYFARILQAADLFGLGRGGGIEAVANVDKVALLAREGVSSIRFGASLYDASLAYQERVAPADLGLRERVMGGVAETFKSFFEGDEDLEDLRQGENLMVRVEMSFDSRKKGGEIGGRRIQELAQRVVREDDGEGFMVRTRSGKTIGASEIRIHRPVTLKGRGHSVDRDDAWEALKAYYRHLARTGVLAQ